MLHQLKGILKWSYQPQHRFNSVAFNLHPKGVQCHLHIYKYSNENASECKLIQIRYTWLILMFLYCYLAYNVIANWNLYHDIAETGMFDTDQYMYIATALSNTSHVVQRLLLLFYHKMHKNNSNFTTITHFLVISSVMISVTTYPSFSR